MRCYIRLDKIFDLMHELICLQQYGASVRMSQPEIPLKLRKDKLVFLMIWQMPLVVIFSTLCKLIDFKRMEPLANNSKHSLSTSIIITSKCYYKREVFFLSLKDTSVVLPPSI